MNKINGYSIGNYAVGQRVTTSELRANTYNVYFLLSNTEIDNNTGGTIGTIEFIGPKQNKEMLEVHNQCIRKYGRKPMILKTELLEDTAECLDF